MSAALSQVSFSLEDVVTAAGEILEVQPDPVPSFRLLNEVLRLPPDDRELCNAQQAAGQSKWVRQLEAAQLFDGSWGRFHSQDTRVRSIFRTSEEAIDRAFALGLWPTHPVLTRAAHYIERVLSGQAHVSDRQEKNKAWPLLLRFILAGRLAALSGRWPALTGRWPALTGSWPHIDLAHPLVDDAWECLSAVAGQAFASGQYRLEDEERAFFDCSGVHVPEGFLESQHALWILSSRPLPPKLGQQLLEWIWSKPDGIRYVRVPLAAPQPKASSGWFKSMSILARFAAWQQVSAVALDRLWAQRDEHGLWDFGSQPAWNTGFPLSESWQQRRKRKLDYSTCVLVVLRRWFG